MEKGLTHGGSRACPRIVPPHEKGEQKHNPSANSEHLKRVNIGEQLRLVLHQLVDQPIRLMLRIRDAGSRLDELVAERRNLVPEHRIVLGRVGGEHRLMKLSPPREQRRYHGSSHAAADIAHEVNQPRRIIALCR